MAINSIDLLCDKRKSKRLEPKSPYLSGDRALLLSRVTGKPNIYRKTLDYVSSFPLAANIYKANSDEFKCLKQAKKKIKKSVLTLPNAQSPAPQICTVSDMNDSEYNSQNNQKLQIKKRTSVKNVRKSRTKNSYFKFSRDARYCSQFNINLDNSSTDFIKHYKVDGKKRSGYSQKKCSSNINKENEADTKPHDVWAVLRQMKRFQFKSSPPISEDSDLCYNKKKKKKTKRARNKPVSCKETRVIEASRTQDVACISSYEVDDSSRSLSGSSSFDRITVIDKQEEFTKIYDEFGKGLNNTRLNKNKSRLENNHKIQKIIAKQDHERSVGFSVPKLNNIDLTPPEHNDLRFRIKYNDKLYKTFNNIDDYVSIIGDRRMIEYSEHTSVCSNMNNENEVKIGISDPVKDFSVYSSDYSGSSKTETIIHDNNVLKGKNVSNGRVPFQLKTISKVMVGDKIEPKSTTVIEQVQDQKRKIKSRLVTTIPGGIMMPKLTNTDIKRRLANMKFPLIILGKDQINSPIEIQSYDHPQFTGLDKHIWPFMIEWDKNNQLKSEEKVTKQYVKPREVNCILHRKYDDFYLDSNLEKLGGKNNKTSSNKRFNSRHGNMAYNDLNKNKPVLLRPVMSPEIDKNKQSLKKHDSITDNMLELLYKKISDRKIISDDYNRPIENGKQLRIHSHLNKIDACTKTQTKSMTMHAKVKEYGKPVSKYLQNGFRPDHPWAKAKRASDFIENVITKIRNGVYYSQGPSEKLKQTSPTFEEESIDDSNFSPKVTITTKRNFPKIIPGFESSLPGLEIKTLNMNQISIKNCIANVMMHFDVTVAGENKQILMSPRTSLMPIEVTESHTKIIKCKTIILNAMLPAELCSILPKMVSLFNSDITSTLNPVFYSELIDHKETCFSTVTETSSNEVMTTSTGSKSHKSFLSPFDYLSPVVRQILGGVFSNNHNISKNQLVKKSTPLIKFDVVITKLLRESFFTHTDIITYKIRSFIPIFLDVKENRMTLNQSKTILPSFSESNHLNCTALELYVTKNKRLALPFEPYDFATTIRNILMGRSIPINTNLISKITITEMPYDSPVLDVVIKIPVNTEIQNNVSGIKNNSANFDKRQKDLIIRNDLSKRSDNNKHSGSYDFENKGQRSESKCKITNKKYKKKGFYKLYRKCKSTTNIPTVEKNINTPLDKIKTLEDFCQIFDSKRALSSVFDGYAARKILTSIGEMKTWISEINSRQALLIMLLTNKKDTANLVRFRPILLQGIAVNRITRATELDMEIEVIERENLNKLSQYEGISYLPDTVENHDQLLEELYWIAKTTASDYQKPFDESSERHLKSLLEKRKKLNPSYLRVMARYVGLGLLKSPAKK